MAKEAGLISWKREGASMRQNRTKPIWRVNENSTARRQPGSRHALAQPAFGQKSAFQSPLLLVKQVIRLVDYAEDDVRHDFRWSRLNIGPIGLIGRIWSPTQAAHKERFLAVLFPGNRSAHSQEISVVLQQLLEAGPRHPDQL